MLKLIEIRNIALIDELKLELSEGLNILSGETGAGKSIIIDSFNFVMGERADKTLIRHNQEFATVQAVFENYLTAGVREVLNQNGIDIDSELILYRKMSVNGKNECRINGRLVTLAVLKDLTSKLADIHGQHEHQSLLNPESHIVLLDKFGGEKLENCKEKYLSSYNEYQEVLQKISKYTSSEDRARKLDILEYQINEIERANLYDGEEEEIKLKIKKISNVQKISENLSSAISDLYKGDFCADNYINSASSSLSQISEYDENVSALNDRLSSCEIELKDIAETLEDILSSVDYSENEINALQDRYDLIKGLERKYGKTIADVLSFYDSAVKERDFYQNSEQELLKLEKEAEKLRAESEQVGGNLSDIRKETANLLTKKIQSELSELGMKNAKFSVDFQKKSLSSNGVDEVEFLISANLGEPLKPLAKVISGGEMSRFMLAIKVILADIDEINTMVFDEIDTGISGVIASVVANKLYEISVNRQVIAVTHLPQLTSMADKHYLIEKTASNGKTNTNVYLLDYNGSIKEISRLIGGGESNYGELHAKEMKDKATEIKKQIANK